MIIITEIMCRLMLHSQNSVLEAVNMKVGRVIRVFDVAIPNFSHINLL